MLHALTDVKKFPSSALPIVIPMIPHALASVWEKLYNVQMVSDAFKVGGLLNFEIL